MTLASWSHVVHVEGMDLSGKSSVSEVLSKRYGGELRRNSLAIANRLYTEADDLRLEGLINSTDLGHLYVRALEHDLTLARPPERMRIQDSTILLRSLAYHGAKQSREVVAGLMQLLPRHPRFGLTVVLTASMDVREKRLQLRRENAPETVADEDLMVERNPKLFQEMEKHLIQHAREIFDATILDTSSLSITQVVDRIDALRA